MIKPINIIYFLVGTILSFLQPAIAQEVVKAVQLDSVIIVASKDSFEVADFVDRVRHDTSFYKAFKNLRYYPHQSEGSLVVYNKHEQEKGMLWRKAQQHRAGNKMWVVVAEEKTNGKIYGKKGRYKYYTAELFDQVFYPKDTAVVSTNIGQTFKQQVDKSSKAEKHKSELKVMMFNPGSKVSGVPVVGKKMAIFDDVMARYYHYYIWSGSYNARDCYVFGCEAKPEYSADKTVIKSLVSYFDIATMEVLYREYKMAYSSLLFEFDVTIKVEMKKVDGVLVPSFISYNGFWDVPMRKIEMVNFVLENTAFEIE